MVFNNKTVDEIRAAKDAKQSTIEARKFIPSLIPQGSIELLEAF